MQAKIMLAAGALAGFTGVALGAFAAHALKARLAPALLDVWQTAVLYQLIHALALLALGIWLQRRPDALLHWAGWSFIVGILLFSGSLYALAITEPRGLGALAPLGGGAFLLGWLLILVAAAFRPQ